ncbi:MAG: alpha/beta fold hydrolase [Sphingomonas sp.]|uniref:alpha/beta fold hydrolase n=1 Tax=Sphingomonas sp. TaxID=28214 RepID=UPI0035A9ACD9|nr:alpha/beta fold hydrolase [Sphingomonas sp.]
MADSSIAIPSWTPPADSGIAIRWQQAGDLSFELAEAGSGDRLALCLHGFPELHYSWRFQIPLLVERGWRVWAPNLRGYGGTDRPEGVDAYHIDRLLGDVAALIDASGAREVLLIAHDWGAIIAWQFAIRKIRPLVGLVIMNVPHPMPFKRELRKWAQLRASWYVFFFQLPGLPEWAFGRNRARIIRRAFVGMAVDKSRFPKEVTDIYADAAMRPGALTAMINYYRAAFRSVSGMTAGTGKVDVPTLMIWGEEDTALTIGCVNGTGDYVADFRLERLPGVSHWVQQEAPEKVNAILAGWLDR